MQKRKIFIDTDFIEGKCSSKGWFGYIQRFLDRIGVTELPYSVQLISIGMIADDGKEYYAVSSEYNPKDASQWVKDNAPI